MKRLVLAGGGHAHVEVLRALAERPVPGTEVVLVSPCPLTPYSGMLPGLVAGHYQHRDCHIALAPLARAAKAQFLETCVTAIDPVAHQVHLADGTGIGYDVLSIDVGSTPPLETIPGASEVGVPVKPVERFLEAWDRFLSDEGREGRRIAVAGGGAGGVEIALALHWKLTRSGRDAGSVVLIHDGPDLLPGHPAGVRSRLRAILAERGIRVRPASRIVRADTHGLHLGGGDRETAGFIVWATGAAAPAWLRGTGLALDTRGFLAVDETLRSVSHPDVFGAGDVATMLSHPRPKSGVYAVRQGPPLAHNLRRVLSGDVPWPFVPQRRALSLISTGGKHAVASWGPFAIGGRWVWRWKDAIDRAFMARYRVPG